MQQGIGQASHFFTRATRNARTSGAACPTATHRASLTPGSGRDRLPEPCIAWDPFPRRHPPPARACRRRPPHDRNWWSCDRQSSKADRSTSRHSLPVEQTLMRKLLAHILGATLILGASAGLNGCVIEARGDAHAGGKPKPKPAVTAAKPKPASTAKPAPATDPGDFQVENGALKLPGPVLFESGKDI